MDDYTHNTDMHTNNICMQKLNTCRLTAVYYPNEHNIILPCYWKCPYSYGVKEGIGGGSGETVYEVRPD